MCNNAIIYARQSFGQEQDSTSIEVQLDKCREYAKAHGINIICDFTDANTSSELYPLCPEGIEAARIDRGFQRWQKAQRTAGRKQYKQGLGEAFQRIAEGGVTHLLVYTRNRLGRTADGSYLDRFLTNFLLEHHVALVCVQDGTVLDFNDDFMSLVMSIKDTLDYKGLKEKAKASMASIDRRINGYRKWSNAFGVVMKNGEVTFDPAHAEAIKYAFTQLVSGASYSAILKGLNSTYRALFGGKQCYQSTLTNLLKNPVYCGYMTNREGVLDRATNIPSPVISYSVWQQAQQVMAGKKINCGKYNVAGEQKHWLPLSGYLRCDCGRRMQMRCERGKVVYECVNPDHTMRMDVTEDVLKTMQTVFIVGALDSRKRLAGLEKASGRVDDLKARLEKLQASLRAKLALVETEEDVALYKPVMDGIKEEIASTKQALLEAQALDTTEKDRLQKQLEQDFAAIMEKDLLGHDDYQRLLQETIDHMTVRAGEVEIALADGRAFSVPRIEGRWHSRRLMQATVLCDTDGGLESIRHYQLHFFDGEAVVTGGRCVLEDDTLSVWIH